MDRREPPPPGLPFSERDTAATAAFPYVEWADFRRYMHWQQGEHVTMIAPTQQGKTTLAAELLPQRRYVMVLATKKRDKVLQRFEGYAKTTRPREDQPRVIVHPPFPRDPDELRRVHRSVFKSVLARVWRTGGWTVLADEIRYLCDTLDLDDYFETLWLQGASNGITIVALTQRPRHIPLEAYNSATHLFFFRDSDMGNVERIAEIGGTLDRRAIMERIPRLPKHQFVYVNTRDDIAIESRVRL